MAAGVPPRLRAVPGATALPLGTVARGTAGPAAAVSGAGLFTRTLLHTWAPGRALPPTAIVRFLRDAERDAAGDGPVLAAVDRAEDLFRGGRSGERRELLDALAEALSATRRVRLLLCVRDDRLDALLRELPLPAGDVARYRLAGIAAESVPDVLRRALRADGVRITEGAARHLAGELVRVRYVDRDGVRTTAADLVEAVPWHLTAVLARIRRDPPPRGTVLDTARLPDVDDVLQEALWTAVGVTAAAFDRDPALLARRIAETFRTPDGGPRPVPDVPDGLPGPLVETLVDHGVLAARRSGEGRVHVPHSDRLLEPLGRLALRAGSLARPSLCPADLLWEASTALLDGDDHRAERLARGVSARSPDVRLRTESATLLGNIAFARGDLPAAQDAYRQAATLLETRTDQAAVGAMLAAIGRVSLDRGDSASGLELLRSAVARLPADRVVTAELARALADSGESAAAAALLDR